MKRFFQNRKGVTLLEGLIAMLLLAVVATGTFGALLSVSRKSNASDMRAEMIAAISQVKHEMKANKAHLPYNANDEKYCSGGSVYNLNCYLPPICDRNNSSFTFAYNAESDPKTLPFTNTDLDTNVIASRQVPTSMISFYITCNGFTL